MSELSDRARERYDRRIHAFREAAAAAGRCEAADRQVKIREANDPEAWEDLQNDPQYHSLIAQLQKANDAVGRAAIAERIRVSCRFHGVSLAVPISRKDSQAASKVVASILNIGPAFVPTAIQEQILEKLDGKAMKKATLAKALSMDARNLFDRAKPKRVGPLSELLRLGKVISHPRIGYHRLDKLPPQLS